MSCGGIRRGRAHTVEEGIPRSRDGRRGVPPRAALCFLLSVGVARRDESRAVVFVSSAGAGEGRGRNTKSGAAEFSTRSGLEAGISGVRSRPRRGALPRWDLGGLCL